MKLKELERNFSFTVGYIIKPLGPSPDVLRKHIEADKNLKDKLQ